MFRGAWEGVACSETSGVHKVVGPIRWLPCWSERRFTLMDVAVVNFMVGQFVFSYPVFECLEVHLFTNDFVIPIFLSMGLALYSVLAFLEGAHGRLVQSCVFFASVGTLGWQNPS